MHVADVLAVCKANGPSTCLSGTDSQTGLHELAATYVKRPEAAAVGLKPPSVVSVPVVSLSSRPWPTSMRRKIRTMSCCCSTARPMCSGR